MLTNCYLLVQHKRDLDYKVLWSDPTGELWYTLKPEWTLDLAKALSGIYPPDHYQNTADPSYHDDVVFFFTSYDDLITNHPEYLL